MNSLTKLIRREHGFDNDRSYDFALARLCVARDDSWRGILPSNYSPDFNPEPPIFAAKFANCNGYRHVLAIANEDGKIALQDTTKRNEEIEEQSLAAQQCHFNAVFDLEWTPNQMKLVSASGDHTARLWVVTGSGLRAVNTFMGHTRSVKTAAFRRNDSEVFATGGRDGAILVWDTRANCNIDLQPRADNCIYSGHSPGGPGTPVSQRKLRIRTPKLSPQSTSSSITGLVFQDSNTLISCGAGDGIIKVWDLRRNYTSYKKEPHPRHSLHYSGTSTFKGFTNLIIDESGSRLYANCMDNTIYCYNLHSYAHKPLACYKGLLNSTFYIKSCLSPDGNYLLSGSSDERAYIWNLNYPAEPLVALNGHKVEVTCVAWGTTYDRPIVTCSDDARHKIWRIGPKQICDNETYRGYAEYVRTFETKQTIRPIHNYNLRELESTPRSLKRLMEQNERTPNSVEKLLNKRSYLDLLGMFESDLEQEPKRLKNMESKGRRLFGSSATKSIPTLTANERNSYSGIGGSRLAPIVEENDIKSINEKDLMIDNNQENASEMKFCVQTKMTSPATSTETVMMMMTTTTPTPSPLSENVSHNYTSPPTTSTTAVTMQLQQHSMSSVIFSPTSNLPNFVIDGEAPHLGIMSPKRKLKEKVDWLTKIRKQKLMSNSRSSTIIDKIQDEIPELASPRTQNLRNCEISPRLQTTPRRRISHHDNHSHPRTPTSSRRNSENTLLRFFSIQRSSVNEQLPSESNHHIESLEHQLNHTGTAATSV